MRASWIKWGPVRMGRSAGLQGLRFLSVKAHGGFQENLATAGLRAKYSVHAALTSRTSGCREAAGWELHWPCMGSEWNSRAGRSSGAGCPAEGRMAAVV